GGDDVVRGRDHRREPEPPLEAVREVGQHREEGEQDGHERLPAQLAPHLRAHRLGPLDGVGPAPESVVERPADLGGRRLGVVRVGARAGDPGPGHVLVGRPELLDLRPPDPLPVERRPQGAGVHRPLGADLEQGAAGELDAVVEPSGEEEQESRQDDRRGHRVGVPADPDEVVVGVGEETGHRQMLSVDMAGRRSSHTRKNVLVTKTAVIIEAMMPRMRVTAKPLTGPVPNWNRKSAVRMVLTFESTIAFIAWRNPSSTARRMVFPWSNSSRIRSKIRTFASTAMPTESTSPASPGRVSVAPNAERPPRVNRM